MFQHHVCVRGLSENAHVGKHTVVDQVMRPVPVTAVLFALVLAPLGLLDFTRNGGYDYISLKLNSGTL